MLTEVLKEITDLRITLQAYLSVTTESNCWFVNDVRQIKSKNLTVIKESLDVIGRRLPVKRTHREIVVFSAVNS